MVSSVSSELIRVKRCIAPAAETPRSSTIAGKFAGQLEVAYGMVVL